MRRNYQVLMIFIILVFNGCSSSIKNYNNYKNNDKPLPIIKSSNPKYPKKAFFDKIEGWVQLTFIIDKEGKTKDIKIVNSFPKKIFDKNAIDALSEWEFVPFMKNNQNIESKGSLKFNFKLKEENTKDNLDYTKY